ncbi:MAG: tyrosine-type recombinase/integrase [Chloroflexi bacterium]|nr:tyrosine-type recombinase/integrase [Chloroflexota bacterium]
MDEPAGGGAVPAGPPITIAAAVERCLATVDLAPRTVSTYRRGLRRFLAALEAQGLAPATTPVTALSDDHLVAYAAAAVPHGPRRSRSTAARRTLQTYLAAIRRFYHDLAARGDAPVATGTLPARLRAVVGRPVVALPPRVSVRDLDRLLAQARALPPATRPARELHRRKLLALVLTLRCTGLRLAELCALTRADLDLKRGTVAVRPRGRARVGRTVPLDPAAVAALAAYWAARADDLDDVAAPAFTGHDAVGQATPAISPRTVQALLARLSRAAGLTTPVTPHMFRHALATDLVRHQTREAVVQRRLGHARAATTRRYVDLVDTEVDGDD